MGRYTGKSCRFVVMMTLTTTFFVVELVTGYTTKSLALVSDSFHMLSDIIALLIGFLAIRISKSNTTGWQRAEVLGALVNSVLLMALCFTIFVDAIQRLIYLETIENPVLILIVGSIGLVINGIGLCLFGGHGGAHGHTHGISGNHTNTNKSEWHKLESTEAATNEDVENGVSVQQPLQNETTSHSPEDILEVDINRREEEMREKCEKESSSNAHLNMRGVFLHVLGDALGSVVVIISALFIWLTDFEWRHYVDPAMSLIIVAIITVTTIPLFRQSSKILMQSLPPELNMNEIREQCQVKGVDRQTYVATAHILFHNKEDYTNMAENVKSYLDNQRIYAATVLPESLQDLKSNT
ncbi:uncharacterized protein [Asterias amurensis]|uniref:uncharacterized protein n=1 Tax=Asterias amurensis TaxID=7602 RepID=UPI003AB6D1BC